MAKICKEEFAAMQAAFDIGCFYGNRQIPGTQRNPYLWSSRMWEVWELGDYLAEKGMTLGDNSNWERGRGNTYRNRDGLIVKLWYGKGQCAFGIERIA